MGGDRIFLPEEQSSLENGFPNSSSLSVTSDRDDLSMKIEDETFKEEDGLVPGKLSYVGDRVRSDSLDADVQQRRAQRIYIEILQGYKDLRMRSENLEEAKTKILSYTPGAWLGKLNATNLSDYDVPNTTSLLLIGPKGSGKSSLVNRISRVFEEDKFASDMAQVSYSSSIGDGTHFLQKYMVPRSSTSFCLYDSRSLSDYLSDNIKVIKRWMTKGVCHGEVVFRDSDRLTMRRRIKSKARQIGHNSREIDMVNFVIFVVSGLSVLKSIDSEEASETHYSQIVATVYNNPFLSFKDDKPVVVFTHGDLLSLADRIRIRIHLGEVLGISPAKQIFDIPESCDAATELTMIDMLRYSLEHADRNLPRKEHTTDRVLLSTCIVLLIALGIAIFGMHMYHGHKHRSHKHHASPSDIHINWHAIRHLWLD